MSDLTGHPVIQQANDNSLGNTEPVAISQVIAQILGIAIAVLVYKGYLEPSEGAVITAQSGIIVAAILSLAGIIGAIAGRAKAYSPRSAAEIAVTNASRTTPTLIPPP